MLTMVLIATAVHFETCRHHSEGVTKSEIGEAPGEWCCQSFCTGSGDLDADQVRRFSELMVEQAWGSLCEGFDREQFEELICSVPNSQPLPTQENGAQFRAVCGRFLCCA